MLFSRFALSLLCGLRHGGLEKERTDDPQFESYMWELPGTPHVTGCYWGGNDHRVECHMCVTLNIEIVYVECLLSHCVQDLDIVKCLVCVSI